MQVQSISVSELLEFLFAKTSRKTSELENFPLQFYNFVFVEAIFSDTQVDFNYIKERENINIPEHKENMTVHLTIFVISGELCRTLTCFENFFL